MSARAGLRQRTQRALRLGRAVRLVWESARGWTALSLGLVIIQATLPLAVLYLSKLIIDAVAAGVAGTAGPSALRHVLILIGWTALAGLLLAVTRSAAALTHEAQSHLVTDRVLDTLHQKSVDVDLAYYEDPRYYDALHRAQLDAPFRPTRILNNLIQIVQAAVGGLGILLLLLAVHWVLAVALFAAVIPGFWVRLRYAERNYALQRKRAATERRAHYLGRLLTSADFAKEVRVFDLGPSLIERFRHLRARLREERIGLSRRRSWADMAAHAVASVAIFGAYAFIAYETLQGTLSLGDLVMYFGAVQRGQSVLGGLLSGVSGLYEDDLFLSNYHDFLELRPTVAEPANPRPVPHPLREGFAVRGVSFTYPRSTRPLLTGIDLTIRPGQMVALVGPNGSGKTTLVKLLCRLYDPDCGSITLDGVDLRHLRVADLRRRISVVFQDYARYAAAVRDNIWFGDVRKSSLDGQVEHAARTAGLDELVRHLPRGYDTVLGKIFEEGEELSAGEWQKVALARALFGDADLLVVDEPTSALDAESEAAVFRMLRRLVRDRSLLVISHRFSTVLAADFIYVLDAGKVIERGTHEDLVRTGGTYARLFELQAEPYRARAGSF